VPASSWTRSIAKILTSGGERQAEHGIGFDGDAF
jgi:hypothetical protein